MRNQNVLWPAALAVVVAGLPAAAGATSTTCTTSTVCAEYINTYTSSAPVSGGVAVHGEANGGIGIRGTSVTNTGFYGASGSGAFTAPGVEGETTNATGTDAAGAFGLGFFNGGKVPGYGVVGYGVLSGVTGVTATASSSSTSSNSGVYAGDESGTSSYNAALIARSNTQTGVLAESNGTPTNGIVGNLAIGVYAVAEPNKATKSDQAVGVEAESTDYPFEGYNSKTKAVIDIGYPGQFISGLIAGNATGSFDISTSGDETFSGSLTTSTGMYVRKTGTSGTKRIAYGAQMASPNIEDVGEATLANGRAFVSIDAALADSIDMRRPYHVFVTPDGDCKGLYVAQRAPNGFVVRELQGGRSSLTFEYRIVAKPVDDNGERLALAGPGERPAPPAGLRRAGRMAPPLTPDERLRQQLGPQKYAAAVAAIGRRVIGR